MQAGTDRICEERYRQVNEKGWSPEHDDAHSGGELLEEAIRWAAEGTRWSTPLDGLCGTAAKRKSKPRLRQLEIAGALIAAEIDRLSRIVERING